MPNRRISQRGGETMLVLSRKETESIHIGDTIVVTINEIRGDKVRVGIEAPANVPIHRSEIYHEIHNGTARPIGGRERKPLFAECKTCGERWKVATTPIDIREFSASMRRATCPNCGEKKQLFVCKTDGPDAVTESRSGSMEVRR
jgi:carbon storage regulator